MPAGPLGRQCTADAVADPATVARAAAVGSSHTIEISDGKESTIGEGARTANLASKTEALKDYGDMNMQTKGAGADGREAVRMYPNNNLKPPVREFSDTFSGYDLLRASYGNK